MLIGRAVIVGVGMLFFLNTGESNDSPGACFNLGNAHVLADQLPEAILAYRRGLRQSPLDASLWENLELVRDQVAYTDGVARHRPPGNDWPPLLPRPAPPAVIMIVLLLHAAAWLAVFGWLVLRRRWLGAVAFSLFLSAALTTCFWGYLQKRIAADERQSLAVVAVNGVTLRRGNGSMYPRHPDLPHVNRGMEARLLHERGGWVQLQFPGGEVGWLPREAVVMD